MSEKTEARSYSATAKEELCRIEPENVCCLLAELSGIVSSAGSVLIRPGGGRRLFVETENEAVAARTVRLLRDVFDVQPDVMDLTRTRLGGRRVSRMVLEGDEAVFVLEGCGIDVLGRRSVPHDITARKCCRKSFLRGVFLACGSVTDPDKGYHLELVLEDESFAQSVQKLIARFGLNVHVTDRRRMSLVYLKGQEDIGDMLSLIGAQNARFAMEDVYIRKGLRNQANRAVNCDSANLDRSVNAALRQTQAIELVLSRMSEESLGPVLAGTARLRLQYPEMSLDELGAMCEPPVGKSGIYHRLRKLEELAEELRGMS